MQLDVGVSVTKNTDEDYDDPSDAFIPYLDESFDDFEHVLDAYVEENNDNETTVNFNSDVSKIAINDILNEMRMGSPIQNDLLNDLFSDEINNNFHPSENSELEGSTINPNHCYYKTNNQNDDLREQNSEGVNDNNLLDQLLNLDTCSTPDLQIELYDGFYFKYDSNDQFNYEHITLPYPEEPDSTTVAVQNGNGLLNFAVNVENNNDCNNQMNYEFEPFLSEAAAEPTNNNQYFECSTNLPMTPDELQDDIQKYVNSEQNFSYTSVYEYADIINDTTNNQADNTYDLTYNSEMFHEYINQQNQLFSSLEPVDQISSFETANMAPPVEYQPTQIYQCSTCSFYSLTVHGLSVHMRVHLEAPLSCTECKFTTNKAYNLKRHQAYGHGNAFCCETCDYVTHSSSKIKSHTLREH